MRRSIKWAIQVVVLMGMVVGTVAWVVVDKSVTLEVDGASRTVHTRADTVSGVLKGQNIAVGEHDVVAPQPPTRVKDGDTIVLRLGRLLHLVVDGQPRDVWVNVPTVEQALAQLGYDQGSYSSVSRAKRLALSPTTIALRTPKALTIAVDGKTIPVQSTAATLRDVVAQAEVKVGPDDIWSAPADSAPVEGMTLTINRVVISQSTEQVAIPFPTQSSDDASMPRGTTVVDTAGVNGTASVVYQTKTVDGAVVSKDAVSQTVLTAPVAQVQRVGTLDNSPSGAQAMAHSMLLDRGWGEDQFSCLVQLWSHESGWRVDATNPSSGAYGIPQALPGSKMGTVGSDWQTNAATQVAWGLSYIASSYSTPCGAWSFWQAHNWY